MKIIRSSKFERFNQMRDRAVKDVKVHNCSPSPQIGQMGPVKTFGDLQESIGKLKSNFDIMLGRN
jgi:hypothetical protein